MSKKKVVGVNDFAVKRSFVCFLHRNLYTSENVRLATKFVSSPNLNAFFSITVHSISSIKVPHNKFGLLKQNCSKLHSLWYLTQNTDSPKNITVLPMMSYLSSWKYISPLLHASICSLEVPRNSSMLEQEDSFRKAFVLLPASETGQFQKSKDAFLIIYLNKQTCFSPGVRVSFLWTKNSTGKSLRVKKESLGKLLIWIPALNYDNPEIPEGAIVIYLSWYSNSAFGLVPIEILFEDFIWNFWISNKNFGWKTMSVDTWIKILLFLEKLFSMLN